MDPITRGRLLRVLVNEQAEASQGRKKVVVKQPRTQGPPQAQNPTQRQTKGLGSELDELLGGGICSGNRAFMDRLEIPLSPKYRTWIIEYLKTRWSKKIASLSASGVLKTESPSEPAAACGELVAACGDLIDLAISRLKERQVQSDATSTPTSDSTRQPGIGSTSSNGAHSISEGGQPPEGHGQAEDRTQDGAGVVGERVPVQPRVPSRLQAPPGRYRVLPIGAAAGNHSKATQQPSAAKPAHTTPRPIQVRTRQTTTVQPQQSTTRRTQDSRAYGEPPIIPPVPPTGGWAVGITTVPSRRHTLLPRTLASLERAGFHSPRLFVDSCDPKLACWYEETFGLPLTARWPRANAFNNWCLSLAELFLRQPGAYRYAIFQDDVLASRNLRAYLDNTPFPQKGYLNLTTFWENEALAGPSKPRGWVRAEIHRRVGGQPKPALPNGVHTQYGRGALGLVFDRAAVVALLMSPHLTIRVQPDHPDFMPDRFYRFIDGAIATALNGMGFVEYVHNPSLIVHNGTQSALSGKTWGPIAVARSWPGEGFDCLSLLPNPQKSPSIV